MESRVHLTHLRWLVIGSKLFKQGDTPQVENRRKPEVYDYQYFIFDSQISMKLLWSQFSMYYFHSAENYTWTK